MERALVTLVEKLLQGDQKAAAKIITIIESRRPATQDLLSLIHPHANNAFVVGITGAPGVGKSTLVDSLVSHICAEGLSVGVIAVDSSSPFSGGAVLGDRIRMQAHATNESVFIRSMANRGHLGGLSVAAADVIKVLDAMGKDVILVETVGTGQVELEIMELVDTTLVVLIPGAGDSIQHIKAGIMEIADIFVINKADQGNALLLEAELKSMLNDNRKVRWATPIRRTSCTMGEGIGELWESVKQHRDFIRGECFQRKKRERVEKELLRLFLELKTRELESILREEDGLISAVVAGERTPYQALELMRNKHRI
jgi:LAO/AO transport system kinase